MNLFECFIEKVTQSITAWFPRTSEETSWHRDTRSGFYCSPWGLSPHFLKLIHDVLLLPVWWLKWMKHTRECTRERMSANGLVVLEGTHNLRVQAIKTQESLTPLAFPKRKFAICDMLISVKTFTQIRNYQLEEKHISSKMFVIQTHTKKNLKVPELTWIRSRDVKGFRLDESH